MNIVPAQIKRSRISHAERLRAFGTLKSVRPQQSIQTLHELEKDIWKRSFGFRDEYISILGHSYIFANEPDDSQPPPVFKAFENTASREKSRELIEKLQGPLPGLEDIMGEASSEAVVKCRCGSGDVRFLMVQSRSADEAMTAWCICRTCKAVWRD